MPLASSANAPLLRAALTEGRDAPGGAATPYQIGIGDSFEGTLEIDEQLTPDIDWVKVDLVAGETYTFRMTWLTTDDPFLRLIGPNGRQVAENDDLFYPDSLDSAITITATATGTYHLAATSYDGYGGSYVLSAQREKPFTAQQIADYLSDGFWADQGYATPPRFDARPGDVLTCDLTALSAAEQAVAREALSAWSQVTGIRFDTTSTAGAWANIQFSNADSRGAYCDHPRMSGGHVTGAFVNIPVNWAEGPNGRYDSYYYQTYIHELGHALGLGHAGNYNGSASYGWHNHYVNDSWQATVMSYFSQTDNTAVNASEAFIATPMIADILAMQTIYGVASGLFGGATTWGVGASMGGAFARASQMMVAGRDIAMTIFDQGGIDVLNLGTDTQGQRINLAPGTISNCYGLVGNLSIAAGTVIENLICGSGNDVVSGNMAANWLRGGAGVDTLFGGQGSDTLEGGMGADRLMGGAGNDIFVLTPGDVVIETAQNGVDRMVASFSVRLANYVENLTLSGASAISGTGNALGNVLVGNGAANHLSGMLGNDTLFGGAGNDTLAGGMGNDRLVGGTGNDLYHLNGTDTVIELAGGGIDTAVCAGSIRLAAHVENASLLGSAGANITGNATGNILRGNNAANLIDGGGGRDVIYGGGGADMFHFRQGSGGVIRDFQNDIDTIRIASQPGARTVSEVLSRATMTRDGVTLHLDGFDLLVVNVNRAALADDLIIA